MALTAYTRFRFLWGALDFQNGANVPYGTAQSGTLGTNALTGVACRRSTLVIGRGTGNDPAEIHFDWLNMTGGAPDDTWTTGDFTTMETALLTWYTSMKVYLSPSWNLQEIRWYREGEGVVAPNPAIRVLPSGTAGTASFGSLPPQVACSITFRTASRKSWGRTYWPLGALNSSGDIAAGRFSNTLVDAVAGFTNTLVTSAASNDFYLVVTSKTKHALLVVESVEVDNVPDVIRRRRWKSATYKKILP